MSRKMDDPQLNEAVRTCLTQEWSLEQIAGRLEQEHSKSPQRRVSAQTIYTWIERDQHRKHWRSFLRCRGKRRWCRKNAGETGHRLEKHLVLKLTFADPGCPYQRGTNENTNGLIRQYFPKGTNFRDITHDEVRRMENRLNNRPRARLSFRTPAEVFFENHPPAGCD